MFPGLVLDFPSSKWATTSHNVAQTLKIVWFAKPEFLDFATLPAKMTVLSNNPFVSVTSEPVMLPSGHGPTAMGQPPRWQGMPASGTQWHTFGVFYTGLGVGLCGVNLD